MRTPSHGAQRPPSCVQGTVVTWRVGVSWEERRRSAVVDSRSVLGFTGMGEEIGGLGRQGSQETSLWPLRGYYLRK